jgi:hypothetical protein
MLQLEGRDLSARGKESLPRPTGMSPGGAPRPAAKTHHELL